MVVKSGVNGDVAHTRRQGTWRDVATGSGIRIDSVKIHTNCTRIASAINGGMGGASGHRAPFNARF